NFPAAHRDVPLHRFQVLVDAMMGEKPSPLARMACEHLGLTVKLYSDVDPGGRLDDVSERISRFERIAVIQVRYAGAFAERMDGNVRRRVDETGGAGHKRSHLVVHH